MNLSNNKILVTGGASGIEFVASVFAQMKEGKNELTFGFSAGRTKTNNESIAEYFKRLNP